MQDDIFRLGKLELDLRLGSLHMFLIGCIIKALCFRCSFELFRAADLLLVSISLL